MLFHIVLLSISFTSCLAVWPKPSESSFGQTVLWLSPDFEISTTTNSSISQAGSRRSPTFRRLRYEKPCRHLTQSIKSRVSRRNHARRDSAISTSTILQSAIDRTKDVLTSSKFVPWKFHSRTEIWEPPTSSSSSTINSLQIIQASNGYENDTFDPTTYFRQDESYNISITEQGTATITSQSVLGSLRALQSFTQLFYAHSSGSGHYTPFAPVSITDSAKWPHRGLNMDISRNVFLPEDAKRMIDALATCKMSRLHLHATDAQSWPLVIPALPELSDKGAYQSNLAWTPDDLSQIQIYGIERGIDVFIEIDMPGHTASIANAYPDLITAFNETDWQTFAAEPPSGELKLNSPDVYTFIQTLFDDLLPRVTPYTTYFHTGGDEVNVNAYLLDETVASNDSDKIQPLLQKFVSNAQSLARNSGLQPIAWEEMLLDWNLTLPSASNSTDGLDTVIQVWRSSDNLLTVLQRGFRALFGDYNNWYLDCGYGGFINPYSSGVSPPGVPYGTPGGVPTVITSPYQDYCSPMKTWRQVYTYDPLINITSDLAPGILGGEVHGWAEKIDSTNLDSVIWPRAAAAAEVLWSGPQSPSGLVDATTRLAEWRERAVLDYGISAGMVQMVWCLAEGGCEL